LLSTCVDREEYGHQHLEKEERIKDEERKKKGKERGKNKERPTSRLYRLNV
jgi:hypothetical protein